MKIHSVLFLFDGCPYFLTMQTNRNSFIVPGVAFTHIQAIKIQYQQLFSISTGNCIDDESIVEDDDDDDEEDDYDDADEELNAERNAASAVVIVASTDQAKYLSNNKILKTRRLTDTQIGYDWRSSPPESFDNNQSIVGSIVVNENTLNTIVVPTTSSPAAVVSLNPPRVRVVAETQRRQQENLSRRTKRKPKSVFVKTKRVIFAPLSRQNQNALCLTDSNTTNNNTTESTITTIRSERFLENEGKPQSQESRRDAGDVVERIPKCRPPLPNSPYLGRKESTSCCEVSSNATHPPTIRMMIQCYNEKLESERSSSPEPNTSISANTIKTLPTPAVSERKLLSRNERCDDDANNKKMPLSLPRSVCSPLSNSRRHPISNLAKSASADFSLQPTNLEIGRGTSSALPPAPTGRWPINQERRCQSVQRDEHDKSTGDRSSADFPSSSSARAMKIRRAKEIFLSSRGTSQEGNVVDSSQLAGSGTTIENTSDNQDTKGVREDSIRRMLESRTLIGRIDLVKSASAGMINVDPDTFERLQLAAAAASANRGYDSLPRSNEHLRHSTASVATTTKTENTSSSGRFSQIAGKFKKARLRRFKEKESGLSTVSMLCRQSLVVDIAAANATSSIVSPPPGSPGSPTLSGYKRLDDDSTID